MLSKNLCYITSPPNQWYSYQSQDTNDTTKKGKGCPPVKNLRSILLHTNIVKDKNEKELRKERIAGPFASTPFSNFRLSPLGLVPFSQFQSQTGKSAPSWISQPLFCPKNSIWNSSERPSGFCIYQGRIATCLYVSHTSTVSLLCCGS